MSHADSPVLEDFESCPMCGHEGITLGGCCANCGETLLEGAPTEADHLPEPGDSNWRLICGSLMLMSFGTLTVSTIVQAFNKFGRDRTLYLLIATSLGCVTLIGLTILVRGIMILVRRPD